MQKIFFKLFWYKVFVHWKLKLLNFLVDSVLTSLMKLNRASSLLYMKSQPSFKSISPIAE